MVQSIEILLPDNVCDIPVQLSNHSTLSFISYMSCDMLAQLSFDSCIFFLVDLTSFDIIKDNNNKRSTMRCLKY